MAAVRCILKQAGAIAAGAERATEQLPSGLSGASRGNGTKLKRSRRIIPVCTENARVKDPTRLRWKLKADGIYVRRGGAERTVAEKRGDSMLERVTPA